MIGIMQDGLVGGDQFAVLAKSMAGVGIAVPAREVAASDVQANAMALLEDVAGGPQVDDVFVGFARLNQRGRGALREIAVAGANDAIVKILGVAIGIDIDEASDKIGIRRAGGGPEMDDERAGDLCILLKRGCGVDQHVVASFRRALIEDAAGIFGRHQQSATACDDGMRGIVVVLVSVLSGWLGRGEDAITVSAIGAARAMQVVAGFNGSCERPFLLVAPYIRAHDEEFDGGFGKDAGILAFQELVEPAQLQTGDIRLEIDQEGCRGKAKVHFADGIRGTAMNPGADQQFALFGCGGRALLAHDAEVFDGILQEDIVPTADIEGGNFYLLVFAQDGQGL